VFLDHVDDEEAIRRQIRRLMKLALRDGKAVGIGHVRPRTYAALMDMLPELRAAGIRLVPVSELLSRPVGARSASAEPPVVPAGESPGAGAGPAREAAPVAEPLAGAAQADPAAAGSREARGDVQDGDLLEAGDQAAEPSGR